MVKTQAKGKGEKRSSSARPGAALRRLEPAELQAIQGGVRAHLIGGGIDDEDGID